MAHNHRESQEIFLDRNSEHHADRLGGLVDDLLDVSRIPQDRFSFEFGEAELEQIVRDVVDRFFRQGDAGGLHALGPYGRPGLDAPGPAADRASSDQLDCQCPQVWSRETDRGHARGRRAARPHRRRDHGIGIAPDDRERIFGRFERAVSVRHYGGLGLGLFICRRIGEAHKGMIRVESEPGDGATFVVELPRQSGL